MRYGVCAGIGTCEAVAKAGYDYIELGVASDLIPNASESEWNEKRALIDAMPLRPEAFNSFVREGKIVGEAADFPALTRYVHSALSRAAQVEGKVIVFGSGGARSIPQDFPLEKAAQQMTDFLNLCAEASEKTGVVVVIEPLCRRECNYINLVSEGAEWARKIGRPGVQNLADTFHMEQENEPLTAIVESADVLAHVHVADTGRVAPGKGNFDYTALFTILSSANYDGRISIECNWENDLEAQLLPSLQHLKSTMKA